MQTLQVLGLQACDDYPLEVVVQYIVMGILNQELLIAPEQIAVEEEVLAVAVDSANISQQLAGLYIIFLFAALE